MDRMRHPKSSNPKTFEGIISMIEDVVVLLRPRGAGRGITRHALRQMRCGPCILQR